MRCTALAGSVSPLLQSELCGRTPAQHCEFCSRGCQNFERIRLFNARNAMLTLPHLREVYYLVSYADTTGADRNSHLRDCSCGVASVGVMIGVLVAHF